MNSKNRPPVNSGRLVCHQSESVRLVPAGDCLWRGFFAVAGSGHGFLVHGKRERLGARGFRFRIDRHLEDDRIARHALLTFVDGLHDDLHALPRLHAWR